MPSSELRFERGDALLVSVQAVVALVEPPHHARIELGEAPVHFLFEPVEALVYLREFLREFSAELDAHLIEAAGHRFVQALEAFQDRFVGHALIQHDRCYQSVSVR
ncbi:MAG TPA: hypothetical protein VGX96_08885 [Candidatus Elarobacter sp.]|nr:hypothetical protein [Candidatus Elarobacter sp.]